MAIPAAAGHGTTLSLACIGNRVYTDVPDSDVYVMLRGADLEAIVAALPTIARANAELASFHRQRRQTLSRPESP